MAPKEPIGNADSFERWIRSGDQKPRTAQAKILSARLACRMLFDAIPFDRHWKPEDHEFSPLQFFRAALASSVAAKVPDKHAMKSARGAYRMVWAAGRHIQTATMAGAAKTCSTNSRHDVFEETRHVVAGCAKVFTAAVAYPVVSADIDLISAEQDVFSAALWPTGQPLWLEKLAEEIINTLRNSEGNEWSFWLKWWDGVLSGNQVNWTIQYDIATIANDIWNSGPETVAAVIALIEERFDLKAQVVALKEQLRQSTLVNSPQSASPAHRAHNQPPELVEVEAEVRREVTIIWAALDEIDTELAKRDLAPSVLKRIGKVLIDAATRILAYCGSLADTTLKAAAVAIGTAGGMAGFAYVSPAALGFFEQVLNFGKGVLDYVSKLPGAG